MHVSLNRAQHMGIVVRDLQAALQFYKDLFDLEPLFIHDSSGPEIDRSELGRLVEVPNPDITFAFMKVGDIFQDRRVWPLHRFREHAEICYVIMGTGERYRVVRK